MNITFHKDVSGYAVSIKTHGVRWPNGGTESQRERAYNSAQLEFTQDAYEAAERAGYYTATTCGRCGGWLAPMYRGAHAEDGKLYPETDKDSAAFAYFVGAIGEMMRQLPDYFARNLADVLREDDEDETAKANAPVYTCEPGRTIACDGVPLFYLTACTGVGGAYNAPPAVLDSFARAVASLLSRESLAAWPERVAIARIMRAIHDDNDSPDPEALSHVARQEARDFINPERADIPEAVVLRDISDGAHSYVRGAMRRGFTNYGRPVFGDAAKRAGGDV